MTSAKSAEYCLISLSHDTTINQAQLSSQISEDTKVDSSYIVGREFVKVFESLPLDVQNKLVKITTEIATDLLTPIFRAHNPNLALLSFRKGISRFQTLNFEIIEVLRQASLIRKISELNIVIFSDLEGYLINNPGILSRNTQDAIIEVIYLLRGYESEIKDLVLHRKGELEGALVQIKYDEFLKSIYGAYLAIVCIYVFLELKRQQPKFAEKVHLAIVISEGRKFAESLHDYVVELVALMNKSNQLTPEAFFSTRLEYTPQIDLPQRVKSYLRELNLGEEAEIRISQVMTLIGQHLRLLGVEHNVWIDVFTDADDPDWRSLMLVVEVAQPLQKTFDELEPLFDEILEKYLPASIADNIFIQYESLKIA